MKKTAFFIIPFFLALPFIFSACGKDTPPPEPIVGSGAPSGLELGLWLDNDTFRISALGVVKEKHLNKPESIRHEMACTAAKLVAIHKIMNAFMGTDGKNISSKKTGTDTFQGTIRNGTVIDETFDGSANTCRVTYEIKEESLRKTVEKK